MALKCISLQGPEVDFGRGLTWGIPSPPGLRPWKRVLVAIDWTHKSAIERII